MLSDYYPLKTFSQLFLQNWYSQLIFLASDKRVTLRT